jgi:hypothetical protein
MMSNQLSVILEASISKTTFDAPDLRILHSGLETLSGKKVIFRSDFSRESIPIQSFHSQKSPGTSKIIKFSETPQEKLVAGIDSSCVLVGETEDGSIYAGRVTTVYGSKSGIQTYCREGPFIFYLHNKLLLNSGLIPRDTARAITSEVTIAERFIRMYMERSALLHVSKSVSNCIIAVDGSLQRSSLELRQFSIQEAQRACAHSFNELIGFSKGSSLKDISDATSLLSALDKGSVFIDITDAVRALSRRIGSNRVVAAKFSSASTVFRVDFSCDNTENDAQVLSDLKFNDVRFRGYPETLRLAHHMSVFDSSTVSSVRSYLSRNYGLVHVASDDLRARVLGKLV